MIRLPYSDPPPLGGDVDAHAMAAPLKATQANALVDLAIAPAVRQINPLGGYLWRGHGGTLVFSHTVRALVSLGLAEITIDEMRRTILRPTSEGHRVVEALHEGAWA